MLALVNRIKFSLNLSYYLIIVNSNPTVNTPEGQQLDQEEF